MYAQFNVERELTSSMISAKRKIESIIFLEEDLSGGKFRTKLVENLTSELRHPNFLLYDADTALIVQVSHPGSAYSKFLEVMLAWKNQEIKQCIFVTQTQKMAVLRNRIRNPKSDSEGNRVYFSSAVNTIGNYANSFLDLPIGILGVEKI